MKQVFKFLVMILIIPIAGHSQTNVFPSTGNVGIGTVTPNFPLEVTTTTNASSGYHPAGSFQVEQTSATTGDIVGVAGQSTVSNSSGTVALAIGVSGVGIVNGSGNTNDARGVEAVGVLSGSANINNLSCFWGAMSSSGSGTITNGYGLFINPLPSNVLHKWGVFVNDATAKNYFGGTVGIGTQDPGSFRLAVDGKIGAREIHVTNSSPFPDYVFKPEYKLRSLGDLEKYITQKGHLPKVSSAKDIKKNGYDMSKMDATLLKKIEELTLYVIDLNKRIDSLAKENQQLQESLKNSSL